MPDLGAKIISGLSSPFDGIVLFYESLSSTMEAARKVLPQKNGTVIWAAEQTQGKGRGLGKRWVSESGENLTFTLILERRILKQIAIGIIPLLAGLAVSLTLDKYSIESKLKWPNDILVERKKICGILCEAVKDFFLIGIGLNCNQKKFKNELKGKATSISLCFGHSVGLNDVLESVLDSIFNVFFLDRNKNYALLQSRCFGVDENFLFKVGAANLEVDLRGRICGIEPDGRLKVMDEAGGARLISAGRVLL